MLYYVCIFYGGVGEVVNTADCGSVMQGFDSLIPPHFKRKSFRYENFFCLCYNIISGVIYEDIFNM